MDEYLKALEELKKEVADLKTQMVATHYALKDLLDNSN